MNSTLGLSNALHWIVLLPLLGAAINGLLGKRLGRANVHIVALGVIFGAFIISALALYEVSFGGTGRVEQLWWHWFTIGDVPVEMAFAVDRLSATLICVVTGVGFLIHVFSTEYMSHDEGYWRYFAYLNLFVAAMSIARPIAASAAATAMTKKAIAWPVSSSRFRLKATKVRLAALSISSTPMKSTRALRRIRTAAAPMEKSAAASAR